MYSSLTHFAKASFMLSQLNKLTIQNKVLLSSFDPKNVFSLKVIEVFNEYFEHLDTDKDGLLTLEQVTKALNFVLNTPLCGEEIKKSIGKPKNKTFTFEDFVSHAAWCKYTVTEDGIKRAFSEYDVDKDGLLDREEVQKAVNILGYLPNVGEDATLERTVDYFMEKFDRNQDGKIDREEFRKGFYMFFK